jgi:glycine dehydrogenase
MGLKVKIVDLSTVTEIEKDVSAILFQYPDTHGSVQDFRALIDKTHAAGVKCNFKSNIELLSKLLFVVTGPRLLRHRSNGTHNDEVAR